MHPGNALDVANGLFRHDTRATQHLPDERTVFKAQATPEGVTITVGQVINGLEKQRSALLGNISFVNGS